MPNPRIDPLNRLLADHLGTTAGVATYKWIHSRDKELFFWIGRMLSNNPNAHYEFIPQVDCVRWVLAKWMDPPSEAWWEAQFHGQAGYPANGYYTACSTPSDKLLEKGVEPTERITMYIIDLRKRQIEMGMKGVLDSFQAARDRAAKDQDREMDAALTDRWTNGNPMVPGAAERFALEEQNNDTNNLLDQLSPPDGETPLSPA